MAFGNLTVDFRQLARVPVRDRVALAQSAQASQIFGNLTPSQIAALFPDYYKKFIPQSGGGGSMAAGLTGAGSTNTGTSTSTPTTTSTSTTATTPTRPGFINDIIAGVTPSTTVGTGVQYGEGSTNGQVEVLKFARRWGISPAAAAGVLNIESGVRSNIQGGRGGNFYGVFQLQGEQIPDLTERAGFGKLTAQQFKNLSVGDQLKVMDEYYKKAGVQIGFFTGDPKKDAAKMWALQLAPSNAQKINYDDPNAVISYTDQANAIEVKNGVVTVGSAGAGSIPGGQKFLEGAELPGTQAMTGEASVGSDANIIPLLGTATPYTVQEGGSVLGANERRAIRERGGITINLDNNAGASASVTSTFNPMIVIPDDATDAQRAAAQSYVDSVAAAYNAKFGKRLKGVVKTTSENQRGRADVIHTEPFNIRDKDAIQYFYHTEEGRAELARITSSTLGQIPGAHFQLPHGGATGKDQGAIGPLGSEVELANILLGNLSSIQKNQAGATAQVVPQTTAFDPSTFAKLDSRIKDWYDKASDAEKRLLETAITQKGIGQINEIMARHPKATAEPIIETAIEGSLHDKVLENQAGFRKSPIKPELKDALQYAAEQSGVVVDIFSGGQTEEQQAALAADNRRRGQKGPSNRHDIENPDTPGAADVVLKIRDQNGNLIPLSTSNPDHIPYIQKFTTEFSRSIPSAGVGAAYMGDTYKIHYGGPNKKGDAAVAYDGPDWFRQAHAQGVQMREQDIKANRNALQEWRENKIAQMEAKKTATVSPVPANPPGGLTGTQPEQNPNTGAGGSDADIIPLQQSTANTAPAMKLGGEMDFKEPNSVKESMSLMSNGKEVAQFNKNENVSVEDGKIKVQNEYDKRTKEAQQRNDKGAPPANQYSMRQTSAPETPRTFPDQVKYGIVPQSPSARRQFETAQFGGYDHFSRRSHSA